MKKSLIYILLILVFKLTSCARIGSPDGGPKDSIPPVMAIAKPMNKTTSFNHKKIVILFDEYIKFEKLNSQLIISPPMEKKPIIKPQGGVSKKISIEFLDSLIPNTTYTFNFGNSIVDNNEGNKLGRFSYVFSTGKELDSLGFSGKIIDPLTDKEIENISIMAYKNANDTLIGNYTPNYLTNTLDSDSYFLENLSEANYKVIALEDKNSNYKYDKGSEKIGFLDSSIDLNEPIDSIKFTLFKEPKNNKIFKPKQTKGNQIILGYQGKDTPNLKVSGTPKENYFISKEQDKDSLYVWFKEIPNDSIQFIATQDTIIKEFSYKLRDLERDTLLLNSTVNGILHPNDSLIITTTTPVFNMHNDSIQLFESDSIPLNYKIISKNKSHKIIVDFKRQTNKNYTLKIKSNAFEDIFENINYPKQIDFSTLDIEEYGEIVLNVTNNTNSNLIIELIDKSSKHKTTKTTHKTGTVHFKNIPPSEYDILVIKDLNNNNKYDTGNFQKRVQPEEIIQFKQDINLRANSEIIENISIE